MENISIKKELVDYSSGLSAALSKRRGPRVDGAFGLANDFLLALATASGWSC